MVVGDWIGDASPWCPADNGTGRTSFGILRGDVAIRNVLVSNRDVLFRGVPPTSYICTRFTGVVVVADSLLVDDSSGARSVNRRGRYFRFSQVGSISLEIITEHPVRRISVGTPQSIHQDFGCGDVHPIGRGVDG